MKYIARVSGSPKTLVRGEAPKIVMFATKLLRDHPGYTATFQSYDTNTKPAHHRVHLTIKDGTFQLWLIPDPVMPLNETRMANDYAEILAVLHNLGIEPTEHPHHADH